METNTDKRKTLIRRLLVEQLLPEEKQNLLKRNSVENEMKKQWKQFEDDPIKSEVKKRIWRNVQRRCEGKSDTLVHIELWHSLAAAVVILLVIGGLLFLSGNDDMGVEKTIKIIAEKNQLYVLPDSTKVWMQPGSSIRYAKTSVSYTHLTLPTKA